MTMQDEETPVTDPAQLRARAADARDRASLLRLEILSLHRRADQDEHEASLWEVADAADDALEALRGKTAALEAAGEETLAAKRAAEDRLRDEKRHLARRKAEVTRAENGSDRDAQDDAAVRLARSQKRVSEAETALAAATAGHEGAEAALDAHRAALRDAQSACARALEAGFNPGRAPRSTAVLPGIGRVEDLLPEERSALALAMMQAGMLTSGGGRATEQRLANRDPRLTLGQQDPSKMRFIRQGGQVIAIPPAGRGGR